MDGYPISILKRKRSSCASGSGYVPSVSTGFCVASTMNGFGSASDWPSSVTWYSCITSSRALCVLAGARLISSARSTCVNTGPRTMRSSRVEGSSTAWPVMSDGIMSGVNCTRAWGRDSACESARTSRVFPRPGTPSMSTWPDAASATSTWSTTTDWPTMARPIELRSVASISAACATDADSVSSIGLPFLIDERDATRGLEQRNRVPQFARMSGPCVVNRSQQRLSIEPCERRERGSACVGRQPGVPGYSTRGGFFERTDRCGMKRSAAAVTQRELSGAANLFGERSASRTHWCRERAEPDAASPQREPDQCQHQQDDRAAVLPRQCEQRRVIVFRQQMDVVVAPQFGGGDEQPPVIAVEQASVSKRRSVDHRHAPATHGDTHRLDASLVTQGPQRVSLGGEKREGIEVAQPVSRSRTRRIWR